MRKKKQGFEGERIIDLSVYIDEENLNSRVNYMPINFQRIGFFPKAKYHYNESKTSTSVQLLYCISGFGTCTINNQSFSIRMGEFFFIPQNVPFEYKADENNPWSIYWFEFKGDLSNKLLDYLLRTRKSYVGYLEYNGERISLFNTIYKNLKRGYSKDNLLVLNMCLLNFLTSLVYAKVIIGNEKDGFSDRINEAITFMKENSEVSVTLEDIAQKINLSVSHFSAMFKLKTGISPIDYFNKIKIQKACDYLEHTNILVKEIAFKVGISDAQYFSRIFTKIIGQSPNSYRKRLNKFNEI